MRGPFTRPVSRRRERLIGRLASSGVAAAFALAAWLGAPSAGAESLPAASAAAEADLVERLAPPRLPPNGNLLIEVEPLFGTWAQRASSSTSEVSVHLHARGVAAEGTVAVVEDYHHALRTIAREPVRLAAGDKRTITISLHAASSYRIQWLDPTDRVLHDVSVSVPARSDRIVLTVGARLPLAEPFLPPGRHGDDVPSSPVTARTHRLAEHAATYDSVSVMVLDAPLLAEATPSQCAALRTWLDGGGRLVLVEAEGALRCDLGEAGPVATSRPQRPGAGIVAFASMRQATSSGISELVGHAVQAATATRLATVTVPEVRLFGTMRDGPWLPLATLFLLGFGVVGGPLLFAVLRRRRAMPRALVTLPLLSAGTFGLVAMLAIGSRPRAGEARLLTSQSASGSRSARITLARAVIAPAGPVSLKPELEGSHLFHVDREVYGLEERGNFKVERDGRVLLNAEGRYKDFVYFIETGAALLPGPITLRCRKDACEVENRTGHTLREIEIVVPRRGRFLHPGVIEAQGKVALGTPELSTSVFHGRPARNLMEGPVTFSARSDDTTFVVTCTEGCEGAR